MITSAVFSPDGTRILTASHDGTARVWWSESGIEFTALRGHERWVKSATFLSGRRTHHDRLR